MRDRPTIPWVLESRAHLLGAIAIGLALPLAALAVLVVHLVRLALHEEAQRRNLSSARLASAFVDEHFGGLARYVEAQAGRRTFRESVGAGDDGYLAGELQRVVEAHPWVDRAFLTDPAGVLRHGWPVVPEVVGRDFSFRDWYAGVSHLGRTYVSEIYRRAAPPRVELVGVATPVRSGAGEVLGYLVLQETVRSIASELGRTPQGGGSIAIFDQRGRLASPTQEGEEEDSPVLSADPIGLELRSGSEGVREGNCPLTGEPSVLGWSPVPALGWCVLARQPHREVEAPIRRVAAVIAVVSALCLAAMAGLGLVFLDSLRRHHAALVDLEATRATLTGLLMHDLRNPLTPIFAHVSMLRKKAAEAPGVATAVHGIQRAAEALLKMINNLLDVVRIEDDRMPIRIESRDVGPIVRSVAEDYRASAENSGLTLAIEGPAGPTEAPIDESLLRRVVENLVTNAVKHTRRGGRVEIRWGAEQESVRIQVVDSGEGIPPELLPRLFQKYGRIEASQLGTPHDTGLGLVFCRMAVELHGGKIDVASRPGEGSVFTIRLPARPATAPAA